MSEKSEKYNDKDFLKELKEIAEEHNKKIEEIIEMGRIKE